MTEKKSEIGIVSPESWVDSISKIVDKQRPLIGKVAKRDFIICQNDFYVKIKKGDSLSEIPSKYYNNLKTEGVI